MRRRPLGPGLRADDAARGVLEESADGGFGEDAAAGVGDVGGESIHGGAGVGAAVVAALELEGHIGEWRVPAAFAELKGLQANVLCAKPLDCFRIGRDQRLAEGWVAAGLDGEPAFEIPGGPDDAGGDGGGAAGFGTLFEDDDPGAGLLGGAGGGEAGDAGAADQDVRFEGGDVGHLSVHSPRAGTGSARPLAAER